MAYHDTKSSMPSLDDILLQVLGMSETLTSSKGIISWTAYNRHRPEQWPTASCFLAFYGFGKHRDGWSKFIQPLRQRLARVQHEQKVKIVELCSNCNCVGVYAKKRCFACWIYHKRNHTERPKHLWFRTLGVHEKDKPRWCRNCTSPNIVSNLRCGACDQYYRIHKKERPRHLWDTDMGCTNCRIPLASLPRRKYGKYPRRRQNKGRCQACHSYLRKYGRERPRYLWGIGPLGWCECGHPAVDLVDGDIPVCDRHREICQRG